MAEICYDDETLLRYRFETLEPAEVEAVASHLRTCSGCAMRYAELGHGLPWEEARLTAYQAAMIPVINSLFAVGLVSLPGMMTGQILSGVSPLIASRYQIMVMCMIFSAAGISTAVFLAFVRHRLTSSDAD